jgi:hypothetical protein
VTIVANCACSLWRAFVACAARSHRPVFQCAFLRPARLSTACWLGFGPFSLNPARFGSTRFDFAWRRAFSFACVLFQIVPSDGIHWQRPGHDLVSPYLCLYGVDVLVSFLFLASGFRFLLACGLPPSIVARGLCPKKKKGGGILFCSSNLFSFRWRLLSLSVCSF